MLPTVIIGLLIVLAVGALVSSWLGARRDRDPASSVQTFSRAMHAMGSSSEPGRPLVRTMGGPSADRADGSDQDDTTDGTG